MLVLQHPPTPRQSAREACAAARCRPAMPQCAHIMAMAVQRLHKGAQVTIGPWIERGFYYDFDMPQVWLGTFLYRQLYCSP